VNIKREECKTHRRNVPVMAIDVRVATVDVVKLRKLQHSLHNSPLNNYQLQLSVSDQLTVLLQCWFNAYYSI